MSHYNTLAGRSGSSVLRSSVNAGPRIARKMSAERRSYNALARPSFAVAVRKADGSFKVLKGGV